MARASERFTPRFQLLADDLRAQICSGSIPNGSQLPSERELGLEHNVSRQTIRSALKILQTEGWVTSAAGRGNFAQNPPLSAEEQPAPPPAMQRSPQIGFIFRNQLLWHGRGFSQRILGFLQVFSSMGFSVAISPVSKDEKNLIFPIYRRWLKEGTMDGYILTSVPAKLQELFHQEANVPVINMGYVWSGVDLPSVESDFRAIYRNIIIALAERQLTPIYNVVQAAYDDPESAFFFGEVISGHKEGTAAARLTASQNRLIKYRQDTSYEVVMSLRRAIRQNGIPRSIIVEPQHLTSVLAFLKKSEIRVPEQTAVVASQSSLDTSDRAATIVYEQDLTSAARRTAEKLKELIETGTTQPRRELLSVGGLIFPEDC